MRSPWIYCKNKCQHLRHVSTHLPTKTIQNPSFPACEGCEGWLCRRLRSLWPFEHRPYHKVGPRLPTELKVVSTQKRLKKSIVSYLSYCGPDEGAVHWDIIAQERKNKSMDQIILELDFHFDSFLRWLECGNQTRPACQLFEFEEVTVTCRRTTPSFCRFVLGVSENVWTSGIVYWTFGGDLMISQKSEYISIFPWLSPHIFPSFPMPIAQMDLEILVVKWSSLWVKQHAANHRPKNVK